MQADILQRAFSLWLLTLQMEQGQAVPVQEEVSSTISISDLNIHLVQNA